jgi:exo-beta-1,3-glucanase (GH17 family)
MSRRTTTCTRAGLLSLAAGALLGAVTRAQAPAPKPLYGIAFSPYADGQDPTRGGYVLTEAEIDARMAVVAPYVQWVRTYHSDIGLDVAGRVAHRYGLRCAQTAWLGPRDWVDANEREIGNLIAQGQRGEIDLAIVGSETMLRRDLSEADLVAFIDRVRAALPAGIPVTTSDVYWELTARPAVIDACDVVVANYYPYWEGVPVADAVSLLDYQYQRTLVAARGRQVLVGETGWPSGGDAIGQSLPTPENSARYFLEFVQWARARRVGYFYFAAFDESWKAYWEGPKGAHWGVWDTAWTLKPAHAAALSVLQAAPVPTPTPAPGALTRCAALVQYADGRFVTVPRPLVRCS